MTKTPVAMITNGFDTTDFPTSAVSARREEFFTIVHTGLFASDGNPLVLWDALLRKCFDKKEFRHRLRIRLVGKVDAEIIEAIKARGLEENLELPGYLPHDRTVEEQRAADLLILPLREEAEYTKVYPGKIFEYLAARRPVLGIGQEDSVSAALLRETGSGAMYDWDKEFSIRHYIDQAWDKYLAGEDTEIRSDISAYTRKALTAKMAELLNSL